MDNNLANKITIARIFLAPLFIFAILIKIPYGEFLAALVFVIAAKIRQYPLSASFSTPSPINFWFPLPSSLWPGCGKSDL